MAMLYFWRLAYGELADPRQIVEQLRNKAVELGWEPGELLHLSDEAVIQDDRLPRRHLLIGAGDAELSPTEVVFFMAAPPGDEPQPFGLASYPRYLEGQTEVTPTHLGAWSWVGVVRTANVRAVEELMTAAAEQGLEATLSFAGMVMSAKKDEHGVVRWEQRPAISEDF